MHSFGLARQPALLSLLSAAAALAVVMSCLPDLQTSPPTPVLPRVPVCGDGIIDYRRDAGGEECDPGEAGVLAGCTRGCVVDCPNGFIDHAGGTNHCYFLSVPASSDKSATDTCASSEAHVVTFASEEERSRVEAALAPDAGHWVGLSFDPTAGAFTAPAVTGEPGWSSACPGCVAHISGNVIPRAKPDGGGGCIADFDDAGTWLQIPCFLPKNAPLGVICEREPPGLSSAPCTGGTCVVIRVTAQSKRYALATARVTASEARSGCGSGGQLVVLETREEREALMKEVRRALGDPPLDVAVWIGLSRPDGPDASWTWENGRPVSALPNPWGDHEPKAPKAARAYALLRDSDYDIQLAHTDDPGTGPRHPSLCEYPPL